MGKQWAETILFNGKVVSVDSSFGIYRGIAIKDGSILAVGSDEQVLALAGSNTATIDLKGHVVIPGLIDNHVHSVAASISELSNKLPDLRSISDLLQWISQEAAKKDTGDWIIHPKFFFSRMREKRWPTKEELDGFAPDNPVFLNGSYGGMVNSKAMEVSNFNQSNHPGILKEPGSDQPSGIILRSAFSLLALDKSPTLSEDKKLQALQKLFHEYNSVGITSITEGSGSTRDLDLMKALYESEDLTVRVFQNIMIPFATGDSPEQMEEALSALHYRTGDGNEWVKVGALKARIDGGILTGTAFMRKPWGEKAAEIYGFSEDAYRGELYTNVRELTRIITIAYDHEWKFTAHVTGGGGVDTLLRALELVNSSRPLAGRRFSIIHGNFFDAIAIQKMESMDIYADMQPMWLYEDAGLMTVVLDQDVLANFHPYRSMMNAGITINGGSDHMVKIDPNKSINPYNPFLSIYTLVCRKSVDGTLLHPQEAISREEALKVYTINNAYASFEEAMKGSIEPGKWADIVVLSHDILTCDLEDIPFIRSVLTMVGGKVVYGSEVLR